MHKIIKQESDLEALARDLVAELGDQRLICLYGDLGSGKTTFVRYLARELGCTDKIKSPSYVIMNTYNSPQSKIYHLDFYRLEGQDPYTAVALDELFADEGALVLIEWADLIEDYLPSDRWEIHFENLGGEKRKLTIRQ